MSSATEEEEEDEDEEEDEEEEEALSTETVRAARTSPLPTARTLPCWTVVRPGSGRGASRSSSYSLCWVSPQTYITALGSVWSGWAWRISPQRGRELLSR